MHYRRARYPDALDAFLQAGEVERTLDRPEELAAVLNNAAVIYSITKNPQRAIEIYREALEIRRRLGDRRNVAAILQNIGNSLMRLERWEEALEISLEALEIAEEAEARPLIGELSTNISYFLLRLGRAGEALAHAERGAAISREVEDDASTARALSNLGGALTAVGRHQDALGALREALDRAERLDAKAIVREIHDFLADTYANMGRYREALEHQRTFKQLHDAIFSEQSQKRIEDLQTRFETAEKDREIAALERDKELAAVELRRQKTIRNSSIGGALVLLSLAGVIATGYRAQKKARRTLEVAYRELEATHAALIEEKANVSREREIRQRLQEIDKIKDEFLANTSHELRTPLYGIIGLAESLIDGATGELPEATKANLNMIAQSGRRLSALVNDILDFSKLRRQGLELMLQPVELRALADVVLTLSRPLAEGKELALVNAVDADLPPAEADESRVHQILLNLVGNAVKFTDSGQVEVSAEIEDGELVVRVSDSGIGIPADKLDRIFESFEQADASVEREYGGTGLGLAVSKQLVELHGGRIWAESPGRGSVFSFTLPAAAEQTTAAVATEEQPHEPSPVLKMADAAEVVVTEGEPAEGSSVILAVDDEPVVRQVLANHLLPEGYRLLRASSGSEALKVLEKESVDLVLLDVMMPRMSGYEVCRQIREQRQLEELPVLFLTAKTLDSDRVAGFREGANDYLSKPIAKGELLARVSIHLELLDVHRSRVEEVKVLRGLLPICSVCKKIREDGGYWTSLELYIDSHSEASFTHGICPGCIEERYPEFPAEV